MPAAKQLETEPRYWVKTDVPLGGTFMPARRFLGENPEFAKNCVNMHRDSSNSIHTSHNILNISKTMYKQLPLPGIFAPISNLNICPSTKTLLTFGPSSKMAFNPIFSTILTNMPGLLCPNAHPTIPGLSLSNSFPSLQINSLLITLYTLNKNLIRMWLNDYSIPINRIFSAL